MSRFVIGHILLVNRYSISSRHLLAQSKASLRRNKSSSVNYLSNMSKIKHRFDNIIKSPEDKRDYRGLELNNGMKVMIISDSSADKCAAAISIGVGFMNDPQELPGLAHFCEHMLFLGTKKYPIENEYSKFISQHGGTSNAFTSLDHTCFYFDITPDHFRGALDRFAQFFHEPLFNEDVSDREVNAVNSEHEKNLRNDSWRLSQLERSTSKAGHPFKKFGTGNLMTLDTLPKEKGINVREELLKFHEKWYSPNIMCLAVFGKESLDDMEEMVVSLFDDIENKNVEPEIWSDPPYSKEQLGVKHYVTSVKDIRDLTILFPIPNQSDYYKCSPSCYVVHLVGHEGPGSLLSALKLRGWCNNLVSGLRGGPHKGFDFIYVTVDLTETGIDHVDDIILLLFQYLNVIKEKGPQEWIFEEYRGLSNIHFRFKDKEQPRSYVTHLVSKMPLYPMVEVLSGAYLLESWKPELITELLTYITPDNMWCAVLGKKFKDIADEHEEWYGTEFKKEKIPDNILKLWTDGSVCEELHLPQKNDFIPTDFDLLPRDENPNQHPIIIQESPLCRIWYKQDNEFLLPKCNISFEFISPLAYMDPLSCSMTYIFVMLFKDALNELAYSAELAGLKWELTNTKYGMVLAVGGYNDKQKVFLEKIVEKMTSFKIDPQRFEILKENYIRGLKNFSAEQPYQQAVYYLALLLTEQAWSKTELLDATNFMTQERLEAFIPRLLSQLHVEALFHGNTTRTVCQDMVNTVMDKLCGVAGLRPLLPCQLLKNREIQLEDGMSYLYEVENDLHKSSCTENFYQCGLQSTESNVMLELLVHIISEPCFNILRTQEQLGYIVFSGLRRSNGVQGLRIIIQSSKHPQYVDSRVEAFLASMEKEIEEISEENFEKHKEALATQRLEKPKHLSAQSAIYWNEITAQQYHFDRNNVEVDYLRTITKSDIVKFYKELIKEGASNRHKLTVHVVSTAAGGAGSSSPEHKNGPAVPPQKVEPKKIENITQFKSSHPLFPLLRPYMNVNNFGTKAKL